MKKMITTPSSFFSFYYFIAGVKRMMSLVHHPLFMVFCSEEDNCHNPSLGFVTKARACKGVGQ
jgi:hypothetical protein